LAEKMAEKDPVLLKAREVKNKSFPRLMTYPNVTGVGVGYKMVKGQRTEEICLRVYVSRKVPKSELQPAEILPEKVEGLPVDVIEADFKILPSGTSSDDPGARHDPLLGGISVGTLDRDHTGTLGGWAVDNLSGELLLLSNWHVLCGSLACTVGERIVQPGPADGGGSSDLVARLHRWALTSEVDAAVARLTGARPLLQEVLGLGPVSDVREPLLGLRVHKSGQTSGVTTGFIVDESATIGVGDYPGGTQTFHDQFIVQGEGEIAKHGDSGSIFIDDLNWLVGLLFAGSPHFAVANPMLAVLDALNISIGLSVIDLISASVILKLL
jgi:hypothetical protein